MCGWKFLLLFTTQRYKDALRREGPRAPCLPRPRHPVARRPPIPLAEIPRGLPSAHQRCFFARDCVHSSRAPRHPGEAIGHTRAQDSPTAFTWPSIRLPQELRLVHHDEYVGQVLDGTLPLPKLRKIGFAQAAPADFVASSRGIAGSAIAATRLVLHSGARITGCISGGTHHAHASFGAGFCVFNDCAIAAAVALQDGAVSRVLVVDLDVHQGNGTAAIFADDPRVFTFSMHQRRGYPQVDRARSDLDIELEDGTGDDRYLGCLRNALPRLLDDFRPQLIVYQSGVDPLEGDLLGRLAMSREGLRQRNALVFAEALARTIPLIITFGGGYQRDRSVAVAAHVDVYRQAAAMLRL